VLLEVAIWRAKRRVRSLVRRRYRCCEVSSIGAVDIHPRHLAFWVKTDTDAQRDALQADPDLQRRLREVLREVRYPAAAIDEVGFAFESQETVDRDYEGSWYYAMK
jgi:hypothetical protein